jgi:hypothetical protein
MKLAIMFMVSCCTIGVIAQENPYCPCQEEARREQELHLVMQQSHHQTLIYIQQRDTPKTIPVHLPHQVEEMRRINVKPQMEEVPIEAVGEEETIEKQIINLAPEEAIVEDFSDGELVQTRRTKLKTRKKLFRKQLKKKKRKIKYRGSCPRF